MGNKKDFSCKLYDTGEREMGTKKLTGVEKKDISDGVNCL